MATAPAAEKDLTSGDSMLAIGTASDIDTGTLRCTKLPCDSPCTISILRGMARTALCALQSHAYMMEASYTTAEHQAQSLARWQPARA